MPTAINKRFTTPLNDHNTVFHHIYKWLNPVYYETTWNDIVGAECWSVLYCYISKLCVISTPTLLGCLTQWGQGKMAAILQMAFSSAFSSMKKFDFRFNLHWSVFLRAQFTINLSHWLSSLATHIYVTRPQWVNLSWSSDGVWSHRSQSTLAHFMACCLMASSHHLTKVDH